MPRGRGHWRITALLPFAYTRAFSGALIGGTDAGEGNTIAFNLNDGISLSSGAGTGNSILGNTIHSNGGVTVGNLAIDLNEDGVTTNDESATPPVPQHDADAGPNDLQNFPVLFTAQVSGTDLTLTGELKSAPSTQYRIEVYNNPLGTEDPSGYGEARVYLGAFTVTTDANGLATINNTLNGVTVADGDRISATATVIDNPAQVGVDDAAAYGSTSEMSQNLPATAGTATPTDLSTGVSINTNGGTDAYLLADNGGSIMNNLTAITFEAIFQIEDPNTVGNTLISYRTGLQHNEFYLTIYPDGQLWLGIDSVGLGELGSVGRYAQLLDGNIHHVAVSWDSATGQVIFYVDGAQAEAPLTYATGATIASGGNLVLGQDQDATADVFEADEAFRGTFHDVRIWDDVRTGAEIALDYEHKYDSSSIPTNLIANWQMTQLAGGTTVADLINPGTRDLTVQHVGAVGAFTPGNATDVIEIAEGSANSTHVTYVRPTDPEVNTDGSYTYSLTNDAGGRFAINATTGEITVANGTLLDYETDTFHTVTVRVTDAESGTYDEAITINLTDVNEAPTDLTADNGWTASTLVNTTTGSTQAGADVTALTGGGYVVTWQSLAQDGDGYGIFAQRYDVDGNTVGGEFQVNTYTTSAQAEVQVGSLAGGGFVITWASLNQDGDNYGVYAQQYDNAGNTVGGEFQVHTTTVDQQNGPDVTGLAGGGYVITWHSNLQDGSGFGVYAQRYDAAGTALGSETLINTYTNSNQGNPSIAALNDGGYVIAWDSNFQDSGTAGVYFQRFDASGNTVGAETKVNTYVTGNQERPSVAALADGGFVVTWQDNSQDGNGYGIYAQRFDATGTAVGSEFQVHTSTTSHQRLPVVTSLADGGFVVTWESNHDGTYRMYAQRFDAAGNPLDSELLVSSDIAGSATTFP